ncbi:MAG: hypothetical protein AAF636_14510 [Pseudomonadota bacterium]
MRRFGIFSLALVLASLVSALASTRGATAHKDPEVLDEKRQLEAKLDALSQQEDDPKPTRFSQWFNWNNWGNWSNWNNWPNF